MTRRVDKELPGQGSGIIDEHGAESSNEGARAMRYVPEDAVPLGNVGKTGRWPKIPTIETLSYTLSGPDAGLFEIVLDSGQITVKANVELDHETKPRHTVTVTVTDSHNASATITVTIHVTDVDEAPAPDDSEYIKTFEGYTENETRSGGSPCHVRRTRRRASSQSSGRCC